MKKTILSAIVLSCFAGVSVAQTTWESLASKNDWTYTNGSTFPGGGIVLQNKESLNKEESLFLNATDEGSVGYGSQNGFAPTSSSATNYGLIYVKGNSTQNTSVIGLSAGYIQGFTATNEGEIWVDGGTAAQVSAIALTPDNKGVNNGEIHVKNGYGILHLPEEYDNNPTKTVAIENTGSIFVEGENSYAVYTNASQATQTGTFDGATTQVTVTNSGTIEATNGASAIKATGNDVLVTLKGQSKVIGVVELGANTDLTIALDADNTNTKLELVHGEEGIRNLTLTNSDVEFTGTQQAYKFAQISATDSSEMRLIGNGRTMQADDIAGNLTIYSDHAGNGTVPVVDVAGVGEGDAVSVTFGGNVADSIGSAGDVATFFNQNVSVEGDTPSTQGAYSGKIEETVTTGEITYNVDANGNASTTFTTSTVADSTKELAALNAMAWRTELSTLTDRMGAIRTRPTDLGAWVRYNGGKLSKDDSWGELKMNTVELGFDMPVGQSSWVLGASFAYGDGDGDFEAGQTDNKKYTLGLYATYMNDNGCFLDVMAKIGQVQSDFNFATTTGVADSGDVDQMGYIFGVEAGHRFSGETLFIEPQIGLVYSYLDSDSTTTSNREVDLDSVESLIGRAGVMFGGNFAQDRASVYGRAFVAHDFKGDVEGRARALSAGSQWRNFSQELAGTWGEFGVGGTYRMTDSSMLAIDLSKTVGGDIDTDYRFNIAAKYMF